MNFHILTLFPEMVMQGLSTSILGKALERGIISIEAVNIRDYTTDKHGKVDDYTYGGGAGMLMQAQPVYDAYQAVTGKISGKRTAENKDENTDSRIRMIYVTPQGRTFNQELAKELAKEEDLIFLCGHYEGIDERVLEEIVTDYISIGDYVLTGGELPAMVMIDSISRLVPGVLHNDESAATESFHNDLLEYPQYSRPEVWMGKRVPEILLSGDHAKVDKWRLEQSIERTRRLRPDLYEKWKLRQETGEMG
ncbi:MAG: tRNA (guanosine(37)-N1)-methyltransferase TrmD [Lachnospiraceae bacterium]|nr:tRNA (guanosine(37)-N1)-methyltransferase TrmD [Lachnospiraceae bacterium]